MNWILRLNSIQHTETYQGLGACESLPRLVRRRSGNRVCAEQAWLELNASDDCTWDCPWPPEVDGVIFWLSP